MSAAPPPPFAGERGREGDDDEWGGIISRLSGVPLLIMLDIDGTLAPTAPRPELAEVPVETRRALAALARHPGVTVVVVSGRSASEARRMVAVAPIWVIGNHGAERIDPHGQREVDEKVAPWADAIADAAARLMEYVPGVHGTLLEDKRWTLSVHYRAADPAVVPEVRATVTRVATELGLVVRDGKQVIEVRPPVAVDKGSAVLDLAQRLGGLEPDASVLYAGDDETDEDAFRALRAALPRAVTVHVRSGGGVERGGEDGEGPAVSAAEVRVDDPWEMGAVLAWLAESRAAMTS
jgi:trehalose-phosphatase